MLVGLIPKIQTDELPLGKETHAPHIQCRHENREQRRWAINDCHGNRLDFARTQPCVSQGIHGRRLSLDDLWRDLGSSRHRANGLEQCTADTKEVNEESQRVGLCLCQLHRGLRPISGGGATMGLTLSGVLG
jgi:hypothetical protein